MSISILLNPSSLTPLGKRDPRLLSYNIEVTELTGGTFWKPYTQAQIEGTEEFPCPADSEEIMDLLRTLHVKLPQIDLYEPRIRTLAKAIGPSIVRFSGSWSTRTYYDFDGHTNGIAPDGFDYVMTREQWQSALDFAKATGAQILVSVANSAGVHKNGVGAWQPDQAELLWNYTKAQGMTIDYAEFMNEPNMFFGMNLPEGYSPDDFARDHDLFAAWLRDNHPETKLVGIAASDCPRTHSESGFLSQTIDSNIFLNRMKTMPEIFSYHSYYGISERGQFFGFHYKEDQILTEEYLGLSMIDLAFYGNLRDQYMPGADLWVTESADGACGGNTWAPTFVETIRFVDELCRFASKTKGVIFHNTLASSAYGLLDSETHHPRPQYWGGLLFNLLAGETVYDTHEPIREGVHLYAFSRKDCSTGVCYVYINNSQTDSAVISVPDCIRYTLSSDKIRSQKIFLNGHELTMQDENVLPELNGMSVKRGSIELPPCSVSFVLV